MITENELKTIANLSVLTINKDEPQVFLKKLQKVLGFIDQIQNFKCEEKEENKQVVSSLSRKQLREDNFIKKDFANPLGQAPCSQKHCFLVPTILKEK
jgi:aspartyl/glutamyl-tRNA(Asn/Gln) amidotransferase C subunit